MRTYCWVTILYKYRDCLGQAQSVKEESSRTTLFMWKMTPTRLNILNFSYTYYIIRWFFIKWRKKIIDFLQALADIDRNPATLKVDKNVPLFNVGVNTRAHRIIRNHLMKLPWYWLTLKTVFTTILTKGVSCSPS